MRQVDLESPQVAIVDPNHLPLPARQQQEIAFVVGLHQRRESPLARRRRPARELGRRIERGDEQDRIRPCRDRPVELARIDDELLGDRRQSTGRLAGGEQLVAAEEEIRLDHHRQGCRPRRGVRRCLLLGVELPRQRP